MLDIFCYGREIWWASEIHWWTTDWHLVDIGSPTTIERNMREWGF